jgi:peptide/nickel transport system substrate-binding protein
MIESRYRPLKFTFGILWTGFFLLATSFFFQVRGEDGRERKQSIFLGISSVPTQLHPLYATDAIGQNINRLVHGSLLDFNQHMKLVCSLCERFEELSVPQQKNKFTYGIRFVLKKDHHFWNRDPLQAIDVKKSVEIYQDKVLPFASPFLAAFSQIRQLRVVDPLTIEFWYEHYDPEHLTNLVILKIFKLDPLYDVKKSFEENKSFLIGAGAYKIESYDDTHVKLVAADHRQSRPDLDFKVVKDETTACLKLVKGELDGYLSDLSPRKMDWLVKSYPHEFAIKETVGTNLTYIALNHLHPLLKEKEFRTILNQLIPRTLLQKKKLRNRVTLANGLFSPIFSDWALDERLYSLPAYDLQQAKKQLQLFMQKHQLKPEQLTLTWNVSQNKLAIETAESIAYFFQQAGIKVDLRIMEWGPFYKALKEGTFELASAQWVGVSGPEMLNSAFSEKKIPPAGLNRGRYVFAPVERLLDQVNLVNTLEGRKGLYQEIMKLLYADQPYLFLWHPHIVWPMRKNLTVPPPYPNGSYLPLLSITRR